MPTATLGEPGYLTRPPGQFADDGGPCMWTLVQSPGWIDQADVLPAVRRTLAREEADDYRSNLLVHQSLQVMQERLGRAALLSLLTPTEIDLLDGFVRECDRGFHVLWSRIVKTITPEHILKMLRDLGGQLREPARIHVGGSCSLMLAKVILRETTDMDVVNELPPTIRENHALVNRLADEYGLRLTHFASHYLPDTWENRTRSVGIFGRLDARIVDPIDVLTGKLFSVRSKDKKDLLAAWEKLDLEVLRDRLKYNTGSLRKDDRLREAAQHNWYALTGEEQLP